MEQLTRRQRRTLWRARQDVASRRRVYPVVPLPTRPGVRRRTAAVVANRRTHNLMLQNQRVPPKFRYWKFFNALRKSKDALLEAFGVRRSTRGVRPRSEDRQFDHLDKLRRRLERMYPNDLAMEHLRRRGESVEEARRRLMEGIHNIQRQIDHLYVEGIPVQALGTADAEVKMARVAVPDSCADVAAGGEICVMCQDNFTAEDGGCAKLKVCGHVMHGECLKQMIIMRQDRCPVCRADLVG